MIYLLMLLSSLASSAPLLNTQDLGPSISFSSINVTGAAFSVGGSTFSISVGSVTIGGQLHIGFGQTTNTCNTATTCTASCPANTYLTGGGCSAGVGLSTDAPSTVTSWNCTALSLTNITAYAFCGRLSN